VDHVAEHPGAGGLLVNLAAAPPAFFARFERLAEIIGTSEADLDAARERYRFYRERGYVLRNHRMDKSA
jgi:DNA polymerase-3 subunit chi